MVELRGHLDLVQKPLGADCGREFGAQHLHCHLAVVLHVFGQAGASALENYRAVRMGTMFQVLKALKPDDRIKFMSLLRDIRGAFQKLLNL